MKTLSCPVRLERVDQVLLVKASGLFSPQTFVDMRDEVALALAFEDAHVVLVDLRSIVPTFPPHRWREMILARMAPRFLDRLVGLVVPEILLSAAQAYGRAVARHGHVRLAFTDHDCALTWALSAARARRSVPLRDCHWPRLDHQADASILSLQATTRGLLEWPGTKRRFVETEV